MLIKYFDGIFQYEEYFLPLSKLRGVLSPQDPKVWEPEETNHHPTRLLTEVDWSMGTLSRICLVMKDLFTSWLTITKWLPPAF